MIVLEVRYVLQLCSSVLCRLNSVDIYQGQNKKKMY